MTQSLKAVSSDPYRIALDDALPILELLLERTQVLDSMTQPDMSGRHPNQGRLDVIESRLRRECRATGSGQPFKWPAKLSLLPPRFNHDQVRVSNPKRVASDRGGVLPPVTVLLSSDKDELFSCVASAKLFKRNFKP